jgi:uncharacterized membrane protein YeaQ/YmgE (transglycosylase-associated protein family)
VAGKAVNGAGHRLAVTTCRIRANFRWELAMGIVWTIVLGFVIGVIAKLLLPGRQNMGFIVTVLLGIGGSLCAGVVGQFFGWYQAGEGAGFIASVIMAVILLVIYGKIRGGSS